MVYDPIKDLGVNPGDFLSQKVDKMKARVNTMRAPATLDQVGPFQLPPEPTQPTEPIAKEQPVQAQTSSPLPSKLQAKIAQKPQISQPGLQNMSTMLPPTTQEQVEASKMPQTPEMQQPVDGSVAKPGDVDYPMESSIQDLYNNIQEGMPKEKIKEAFPEIPEHIADELYDNIVEGMPRNMATKAFPELSTAMKPGETIAGDALGGLNRSAQATAGGFEHVGNRLGSKIVKMIGKAQGKTDEEIQQMVDKGRESADQYGVKRMVHQFSNIVGENPESFFSQVPKTIGDIAQVADLAVGVNNLIKGTKVFKRAEDLIDAAKTMNLDEPTKTVLKTTKPNELQEYINITKKALTDDAAPTASAKAAAHVDDAIKTIEDTTKAAGQKIGDIRLAAADSRTYTQPMVASMNENLSKLGKVKIDYTLRDGYKLVDSSKVGVLAKDEKALLQEFVGKLNKIKKGTKISDIMDLNEFLKNNAGKVENASKTFQSMVSTVRKSINNTIMEEVPAGYKTVMQKYSEGQEMLERIEKAFGDEGQKGQAALHRLFGQSPEATRQLFTDIKKSTGVDLFKEARLSKFVMESMGDSRGLQALIENIPTSKTSLVTKGAKAIFNKAVGSPIKQAERFISKPPPGVGDVMPKIKGADASGVGIGLGNILGQIEE